MNSEINQTAMNKPALDVPFMDQYIQVPGGKVWVRTYGTGTKTPLVILHGGPGCPSDYLFPLKVLAIDYPVIIYDQLGCGRSYRGQISDYTCERYVEELECILDELQLDQAILLGHSWGSMLAVESAVRNPKRFTAMILLSPCLSMERTRADMARLRSELPVSLQNTLSQLEEKQQTNSVAYQIAALAFYQRHLCRLNPWPEILKSSTENWGTDVYHNMWGPAEFLPQGSLNNYEREKDLKLLDMPILFSCGRFDEITPEATTSYFNASKNGQLHIFEKSAHVAHLEEPEEFLRVVQHFIGSIN